MEFAGKMGCFVSFVILLYLAIDELRVCQEIQIERSKRNTGTTSYLLKVYEFSNGVWKLNSNMCESNKLNALKEKYFFKKSFIQSGFGLTKLFINSPIEDFLSEEINRNHTWEPWVFNSIYKLIRLDSDIGVLDLGANIGAYSLQLAQIGRQIISIEAAFQNVRHICASVIENKLQSKITIVHNVVSNNNVDVAFVLPRKGEFALGFVDQLYTRQKFFSLYGSDVFRKDTISIKSVALDNVLTLPEFSLMSRLVIKMDVPGLEHRVLQGAEKLLETGKVVGIYIAWDLHRGKKSGDYIIRKLDNWNFVPFDCKAKLEVRNPDYNKPCTQLNACESEFWENELLWVIRTNISAFNKKT